MVPHQITTERHLPYGITQHYLPPDTDERPPPLAPSARFTYRKQMKS